MLAWVAATALYAREVPGEKPRDGGAQGVRASACSPATAYDELDLNNVRARIETGGNMWMDRAGSAGPAYEVPKTPDRSGAHALFAGALWMGGLSPDNQLKLAAVRFRTLGNDYWPGPLTAYDTVTNTGDASIDGETCNEYDRTWKTYRMDAQRQDAYFRCLSDPECDPAIDFTGYSWPSYFEEWPAHGDVSKGQDYNLAPYHDTDGNNEYNPDGGDYPGYDLQGVIDCTAKRREDAIPLFGDQNIWWVFNDKGNTHTESGGQPIGMEIRAQAFAFSTNDEINNMTFYNYVLINQGTQTLNDTYFGQWADVEIGGANDDYVGCDVQRGLGYGYNGDEVDEGAHGHPGYGGPIPPPPAVGIDFFEGPYQDYDGIDNPLTTNCQDARDSLGIPYGGIGIGYGDGEIDNERYGMRAFVYHNNASGPIGDPTSAGQYYNYLKAIWGDNTPMTYGGNGYSPAGGGTRAYYMFPGSSDTYGWGTDCVPQPVWDEVTAGNAPEDRRFIQSAGPFTLEPGAYNNITVGVVWARATAGGVAASVELMKRADDKAQSLFDNCFRILDGPDAPEVTIRELDRELILYISNPLGSNNYNEEYVEKDATIPETSEMPVFVEDTMITLEGDTVVVSVQHGTTIVENDQFYRFQGYQIFQVKDGSVSPDELHDPDKARLVAQVDLKDHVSQLINWEADADMNLPVPQEMVFGNNEGIVHSFRILEDKFASGDSRLTNFKTYYYMALAYGYNNYQDYDPVTRSGQAHPYLAGRKSSIGSIRSYAGIPHKPEVENGGTVVNAEYGDGFELVRLEGQGNGGNPVALTQETMDAILASPISRQAELKYRSGLGPVNVKVVDPLKVPAGDFEIWLEDTTAIPSPAVPLTYTRLSDASWTLVRLSDNPTSADTVRSVRTIQLENEQLIPQWGMSITMEQPRYSGANGRYTPPVGKGSMEFKGVDWYEGIPDMEGEQVQNWIRSGAAIDDELQFPDYEGIDENQEYEKLLGGTWAPWGLAGRADFQPSSEEMRATQSSAAISEISSIEVVFTPDKSKWSRCVVVETGDDPAFTQPVNTKKLHLRNVPSVDKNGLPAGAPGANDEEANLVSPTGMSWFPGYAIDIETGERLNIFFGENSFAGGGIGRDMLWNPSDQLYNSVGAPVFGGGHWIYVTMNKRRAVGAALAPNRMPQYDQGAYIRGKLGENTSAAVSNVYAGVAWVGSALLKPGMQMKTPQQGLVPGETHIRLNLSKAYFIYSQPHDGYQPEITNVNRNRGLPLYAFNTGESVAHTNVTEVGRDALDLIGVVPNPYYAYSGYETTRLDNRVKFINLPRTCTVSIYTVSGTLVRQYKKDNELTYLDWDLKNNYNAPIAGGTYLVHIDAPGLGEKVIKWFGVMRPVDLQNF